MQKKVISQFYLLSCLFSLGSNALIGSVYVTFLMKNGLSLFEVNLVNTCFFLTLFLCEIPTGACADIFGRKTSFLIACGLLCLSMFIYGSSHTLVGFIIAEILGAAGSTFRNGAFRAWLVDSLKHHGNDGPHQKIFARSEFYCKATSAIGAVIGAYLASFNMAWPWFVGGTIMVATFVVARKIMKEEYFERRTLSIREGVSSMIDVARTSIRYGKEDSAVRFILAVTFIQIFSVMAFNMYWQPHLKNHGMQPVYFGYVYFGIMALTALGLFIVAQIDCGGREKRAIVIIHTVTGVCMIAAACMTSMPLILVFFLLHEIPRGSIQPVISSFLHHRIPSGERATIDSFCSIAPHIGGAIGLLLSGVIAQKFGISVAWIVSGIILTGGALLLSRNGMGSES